jgi:hypothetical protein
LSRHRVHGNWRFRIQSDGQLLVEPNPSPYRFDVRGFSMNQASAMLEVFLRKGLRQEP